MYGGDHTSGKAACSCQPGENGKAEEGLEKGLADNKAKAAEQPFEPAGAFILRRGEAKLRDRAVNACSWILLADKIQGHPHGLLQPGQAGHPAVDRRGRKAALTVRIFSDGSAFFLDRDGFLLERYLREEIIEYRHQFERR